jgi:polysaccharide pyruvyl transferase WcaK-like protein
MLPQTYGPFERAITRAAARYVIKNASAVYSRDRRGLEFLRLLMKKHNCNGKLRFVPDVAFVMDTTVPGRLDAAISRLTGKRDNIVIGFNISGLLFNGGYTRNNMFGLKADYERLVYDIIARLMSYDKTTVLLIPHVFPPAGYEVESDEAACLRVLSEIDRRHNGRILLAGGKYSHTEIKYVIGLCDFFIGSRMHACIAAMSQCIPTVGIAYSWKFEGVFESVNMADCVADARYCSEREITEKIDNVFARRYEIRQSLEAVMPEVKKNILNIFME